MTNASTAEMTETTTTLHPFERAGLGKAPFRCVGFHVAKFQACHGAPIQPGASCDYCATGIMNVYTVRSADGRTFKVGCDCVAKTGDAKLKKAVDTVRLAHERKKRGERTEHEAEALAAALANPATREKLSAQPHPKVWRAELGDTLLHWAEWMAKNAGAKGRKQVLAAIAKVEGGVE